MSLFDKDLITKHPFDCVNQMDPVDGLVFIYNSLTGGDFNDPVHQYDRIEKEQDKFQNDLSKTLSEFFAHYENIDNINIGLRLKNKAYVQDEQRSKYPDKPRVFHIQYYEWRVHEYFIFNITNGV